MLCVLCVVCKYNLLNGAEFKKIKRDRRRRVAIEPERTTTTKIFNIFDFITTVIVSLAFCFGFVFVSDESDAGIAGAVLLLLSPLCVLI